MSNASKWGTRHRRHVLLGGTVSCFLVEANVSNLGSWAVPFFWLLAKSPADMLPSSDQLCCLDVVCGSSMWRPRQHESRKREARK